MPFVTRVQQISGPKNDRAVDVAKHRLDQITPLAQKELTNSLKVNGWPCLIYHRLQSGRTCSCSLGVDNTGMAPVFDEQGNASQEHINTLLTGGRFNIGDYGTKSNVAADPGVEPVLYEHVQNNPNRYSGQTDSTGTEIDPINHIIEELESGGGQDVNPDAYDNGSCSVCYGTGFVGGLELHNGLRMVIDPRHPSLNLHSAQVVQTETPYCVEFMGNSGYAEFVATAPKFGQWHQIAVFNGQSPVPSIGIEVYLDDQWWPVSAVTREQTLTGIPVAWRVKGKDGQRFTHIVLQVITGELVNIEFPHLNTTGSSNAVLDGTQDVSLSIGPNVSDLLPGDVVVDAVLGKVWRIITTESLSDAKLRKIGWSVNARVVQGYDRWHRLPAPQNLRNRQPTKFNRPIAYSNVLF